MIRISERLVWDILIGVCHRQCLSLIHAFRPLGPEFSLPGSASHQAFGRRLKVVRNLGFFLDQCVPTVLPYSSWRALRSPTLA